MTNGHLTPHFTIDEMACRCGSSKCNAVPMDMEFMQKLEGIRVELGHRMVINSASRCEMHNGKVGGSPTSQHLYGLAADIKCPSDAYKRRLIALSEKHGMKGIGVYKHFVHLDLRLSSPARWEGAY